MSRSSRPRVYLSPPDVRGREREFVGDAFDTNWIAPLGPGVNLGGMVSVGEGAFLGVGAKVIPGVHIGAWAIVGAGAVVIRDVPDHAVVVGVPARPIRSCT